MRIILGFITGVVVTLTVSVYSQTVTNEVAKAHDLPIWEVPKCMIACGDKGQVIATDSKGRVILSDLSIQRIARSVNVLKITGGGGKSAWAEAEAESEIVIEFYR